MYFLDIILGIFLLLFLIKGLRNGFVRSVINLIGLIVIIFVISKMGHLVKETLMMKFDLSELIATIISYLLIALIIFIVMQLVIKFVHMVFDVLHLAWLDKLLGMIFGVVNGALIIAIVMVILNLSPFSEEINEVTDDSQIVNYVQHATEALSIEYSNVLEDNDSLQKKVKELETKLKEATNKAEEEFQKKIIKK